MVIGRVERYTVEHGEDGVTVRLCQGWPAARLGLLSLGVLIATWRYAPFGPRAGEGMGDASFYWTWQGFFAFICLLTVAGAFYRERWTITTHEIVERKSLGSWSRTVRVARAGAIGIRVEREPDREAVFPHRLCFLDADRQDTGVRLVFQLAGSTERFVDVLRAANLDVNHVTGSTATASP
jgi:hypothetical protein